jgi:hypothetical protein
MYVFSEDFAKHIRNPGLLVGAWSLDIWEGLFRPSRRAWASKFPKRFGPPEQTWEGRARLGLKNPDSARPTSRPGDSAIPDARLGAPKRSDGGLPKCPNSRPFGAQTCTPSLMSRRICASEIHRYLNDNSSTATQRSSHF